MTLDDLQVMTIAPHFASPPKPMATRGFDLVGLSNAPKYTAFVGRTVVHTLRFDFLMQSAAEIRALEGFFVQHKGKWQSFWLPSWHSELRSAADILDGEDELLIDPVDYETNYFPAVDYERFLGQHLFLLHREGDLHVSEVSSVVSGTPEILTLATPVTRDFIVGDFIVGFLYHARWLNDELELEFRGPNQASATLAAQQLVPVDLGGS